MKDFLNPHNAQLLTFNDIVSSVASCHELEKLLKTFLAFQKLDFAY